MIGANEWIVVNIYTNGDNKITEVQDRWNNEIPEGPFAKVRKSSLLNLANPLWWTMFWIDFGMGMWVWALGCIWEMRWWEVSSSHLPLFPLYLDSTIKLNGVVPETVKASWG
jgi:hypothetical protein